MKKNKIAVVTGPSERMPGFRMGHAFKILGYQVDYFPTKEYDELGRKCQQYDFAIYDDNADYNIYKRFDLPSYYMAIDTTIEGGDRCIRQSQNLDFIFFAQKKAYNKYAKENSMWLPNAHNNYNLLNLPKPEN